MKAAPLLLAALFAASTALAGGREAPIGGQTDQYGCLSAAGQMWSDLRSKCVQVFDVADIRLPDPYSPTQAVYVLLSSDKEHAELFGLGYKHGVWLYKSPTGYASANDKVRLEEAGKGWKVSVYK